MSDPIGHVPVLPDSVLKHLAPSPGEVFVDATAGLGGHAAMVAEAIGPGGTVVLNDLDASNLDRAGERVEAAGSGAVRVVKIRGNFADLPDELESRGLVADMILADLGFASTQVDDPARGLSFRFEGPLDMRLNPDGAVTAAEIVNESDERELADLIYEFGEERESRRIARKIVEARRSGPIQTTSRLAEIVRSAARPRHAGGSRIDPATRTFQALRIAVNDELGSLRRLLNRFASDAVQPEPGCWVRPGSRAVWISFHSLEDRAVKQALADLRARGAADLLTRKPDVAGDDERMRNPRARSAKLRAVRIVKKPPGEMLPL